MCLRKELRSGMNVGEIPPRHFTKTFRTHPIVRHRETMDAKKTGYVRKVRRAAYSLFSMMILFYFLAFINPAGTDFTRSFYLSVAAGLFTSSLVIVVNAWLHQEKAKDDGAARVVPAAGDDQGDVASDDPAGEDARGR